MTGYQDSGMWAAPEADPRDQGATRGERECVLGYLAAYRQTLVMKCEGLTPEQLALRSVPPSTLSLLGLVRHMAAVEQSWFRRVMERNLDLPRLYGKSERQDADFDDAVGTAECVEEAFAALRTEIAHAQAWVAERDFDTLGLHSSGMEIELRDVLVHLVEEYARHCGHADLLRECIDGRTGQ